MTDPVLTYYDISPQVVAFSTTRRGGCSVGNYGAFNVNYYCGDKPSHIAANRLALCRLLQISDDRLVYPHQVHGTEVRRIGKDFLRLAVVIDPCRKTIGQNAENIANHGVLLYLAPVELRFFVQAENQVPRIVQDILKPFFRALRV